MRSIAKSTARVNDVGTGDWPVQPRTCSLVKLKPRNSAMCWSLQVGSRATALCWGCQVGIMGLRVSGAVDKVSPAASSGGSPWLWTVGIVG